MHFTVCIILHQSAKGMNFEKQYTFCGHDNERSVNIGARSVSVLFQRLSNGNWQLVDLGVHYLSAIKQNFSINVSLSISTKPEMG